MKDFKEKKQTDPPTKSGHQSLTPTKRMDNPVYRRESRICEQLRQLVDNLPVNEFQEELRGLADILTVFRD